MFIGGISDKLGNKYEVKWLVRQFIDVLGGSSEWIRTEGITDDFKGFEFAVGKGGHVEWHQTKISTTNGNWTISALEREGVLQAFKRRFDANSADRCFFVSEDPSKDIHALASKAKIANDEIEFLSGLGKKHEENYRTLLGIWGTTNAIGFGFLKRSYFVTIPQAEVESSTNSYVGLYFSAANATAVVENLRGYLEARLNKAISTESARAELRDEGNVHFKAWSLDPTLRQRLKNETAAYLETYSPFGAGGAIIPRAQSEEAAECLSDPEGPTVLLLTGVAGSGKSGVVREIIQKLTKRGIIHLALRIDHNLHHTRRSFLGKAITDREESPAATLKGLEPSKRAVLIIDQVDAVSEVSGRNGSVKEVVLQIVEDARAFGTVHVLIVCRSFDLENDRRLKILRSSNGVQQIDIPLLNWESEVEPLLLNQGMAVGDLTQKQKSLLCLPLNLAIFLEIRGGLNPTFASRTELFEKLIEHKDRAIRQERPLSWSITAPLIELAEWMSERQRLDAPREVIANYGGALDLLTSEGVLVKFRDRVNFFHESFFDYIFARAFSTKEVSIVGLLNSAEQHLFRRTQVRQILETLRQGDTIRYEEELRNVLKDPSVRFHIKAAVAQWLGSLTEPSAVEREAILSLDDTQERFPLLLRSAALGSPGWFDRLNEVRWIEKNLASASNTRLATLKWWLSDVANARPTQVVTLLDKWWDGNPAKADELIQWLGFLRRNKPNKEISDFCVRVIRSIPPSLFSERSTSRHLFSIPFWMDDYADFSAGILEALFDVWFNEHPNRHPFDRDDLGDLDNHALGELAGKTPAVFLQGTTAALIRTVNLIRERKARGERDYTFMQRSYSGHRFGADEFLSFYRNAITALAKTDPTTAEMYLSRIGFSDHEVFTHLYLEVIAANPDYFATKLPEVLSSPFLFESGWDGADWKSFSDAAREALPLLSAEEALLAETKVLNHRPEIDFAIDCAKSLKDSSRDGYFGRPTILYYLNRSGHTQACILSSIGEDRLTELGREQLKLLRRKFRDLAIPEPRNSEVHVVNSPIKRRNAEKMNDDHWLGAMVRYSTDEWSKDGGSIYEGGAQQLASELQQLTKVDPERFSRLILMAPKNLNGTYLKHILWALAEADNVSDSTLIDILLFAHSVCNQSYGSDIARIFEKHPSVAKDHRAFELLCWYIEHGTGPADESLDAAESSDRSVKIEDLLQRGGKIHVRGVNSVRGWAAEALGSLLWSDLPSIVDVAWEILDRRVGIEQSVSVRTCLVKPLLPLYNHDRRRAAHLLERLSRMPVLLSAHRSADWVEGIAISLMLPPPQLPEVAQRLLAEQFLRPTKLKRSLGKLFKAKRTRDESVWISPLVSHQGTSLIPYIIGGVPEIGQKLLFRLLASEDETTHLIGSWHIFRAAFQKREYTPTADNLIKKGVSYRRLAADVASLALTHEEFRDRAEKQLIAFFNDADKNVRSEAAGAFRAIEGEEFIRFYQLAEIYLESPAFEEQSSFSFLHKLEEATCDVYPLVIRVAERMIEDLNEKGTGGGRRHSDLHQLQDLLKKEYTASEGDLKLRSRLLDLIDHMLEEELYGIDGVVLAHER